jgi:hypothetical protein
VIDTTALSQDEVVAQIVEYVRASQPQARS